MLMAYSIQVGWWLRTDCDVYTPVHEAVIACFAVITQQSKCTMVHSLLLSTIISSSLAPPILGRHAMSRRPRNVLLLHVAKMHCHTSHFRTRWRIVVGSEKKEETLFDWFWFTRWLQLRFDGRSTVIRRRTIQSNRSRIEVQSPHVYIFFICTRYSVLQPQDWNKLLLHINVKYETTSGKWWHDLFMTTQITPRRQFDIAIASDDNRFALCLILLLTRFLTCINCVFFCYLYTAVVHTIKGTEWPYYALTCR